MKPDNIIVEFIVAFGAAIGIVFLIVLGLLWLWRRRRPVRRDSEADQSIRHRPDPFNHVAGVTRPRPHSPHGTCKCFLCENRRSAA